MYREMAASWWSVALVFIVSMMSSVFPATPDYSQWKHNGVSAIDHIKELNATIPKDAAPHQPHVPVTFSIPGGFPDWVWVVIVVVVVIIVCAVLIYTCPRGKCNLRFKSQVICCSRQNNGDCAAV